MSMSNYPGGFNNGLIVRGLPILNAYSGTPYWVDSVNGQDTNAGTFQKPFKTMAYAAGQVSAGDQIHVKSGHTETIDAAADLAFSTAGIAVIGYGHGDRRPVINFTTSASADMDIDAADIQMYNFIFETDIAATSPIDVNADDFGLFNCEFKAGDADAATWLTAVSVVNMSIIGLKVKGSASDGATAVLDLQGTTDTKVIDFWAYGNHDSGFINSNTTANNNILVHTGYYHTEGSEDRFFTIQATDNGWVGGLGERAIFIRVADNAANIDEVIVQSDGSTITSDLQFVSSGIHVVNLDNERTLAWTGVSASTDA